MDEEKLITAIVKVVLQILREEKKLRVLALFSAGITGLEEGIRQLKRLQENGNTIYTAFTPNAKKLYEDTGNEFVREYLANSCFDDDVLYRQIFPDTDIILIPTLTMNTAAKIAAGIADNAVTRLVQLGILHGKRIVAAQNACCVDPLYYQACPVNYRDLFAQKIEVIAGYGIELADANRLAEHIAQERAACPNCEAFPPKKVLDAKTVRMTTEKRIQLQPGAIVTPLAKDLARERGIIINLHE